TGIILRRHCGQDITCRDEETCAELHTTTHHRGAPPLSRFVRQGGNLTSSERHRYFAFGSTWKIPNVFPSVSTKYPCQQVFGTANLGKATIPPSCAMIFAVASKFSTSSEHTNAFVPLCGGGVL